MPKTDSDVIRIDITFDKSVENSDPGLRISLLMPNVES